MSSIALSGKMDKKEYDLRRKKAAKPLLWLGMVSICMIFAGLTSYAIVAYSSGKWIPIKVPSMFTVSTILILVSSIPMHWAFLSAKKNKFNRVRLGIILTLILGIAFSFSQYSAWTQLFKQGIVFAGSKSYISGSLMYLLSFLHLLHLLGGLICLTYGYFKSRKNKYNSNNFLGLQLISIYWHFLDGLWIYLFLFLNLIAK